MRVAIRDIGIKICKGQLLEGDVAGIFVEVPSSIVKGARIAPEAGRAVGAVEFLLNRARLSPVEVTSIMLFKVRR